MSEINTHEDLGGVYTKLLGQLNEIDATLDATKDQKTAGKRLLRKEMIEKHQEEIDNVSSQIIKRLGEYTDDQKFAVFFGIATALSDAFSESGDKYLTAIVDSQPVPEKITLSEEEMKALTERRSALYKHAKSVRELATMFGGSEADFPMPKRRSGGSGVRGKRKMSLYTWTVNDDPFTDTPPLVKLAEKFGLGTAAGLRKAIMEQLALADLKNPPNPLTYNAPNGDVLVGIRPEDSEADEESDEDDNGEDDDEDDEDDES